MYFQVLSSVFTAAVDTASPVKRSGTRWLSAVASTLRLNAVAGDDDADPAAVADDSSDGATAVAAGAAGRRRFHLHRLSLRRTELAACVGPLPPRENPGHSAAELSRVCPGYGCVGGGLWLRSPITVYKAVLDDLV